MRKLLAITVLIGLSGCNSQDISILGQIARKTQAHVSSAFGEQSDIMIKSLPLLPPEGATKKGSAPAEPTRTLED